MQNRSNHQSSRKAVRAGLLENLRTTFWFLPTCMLVGATVLALIAGWVDRAGLAPAFLDELIEGSPETARSLLSGLATTTLTIATVSFSIMIVALSFVSGQLGPRILRNFIRDRTNQAVLGWFLSVHVYSMSSVLAIRLDGTDEAYRVTVLVAVALGAASLLLLIRFIHHIAVGIQADTVISDVRDELFAAVDRLLPDEREREAEEEPIATELDDSHEGEGTSIRSERRGYIQAINYDRLMALAAKHDLLLICPLRAGDYVTEESTLIRVADADDGAPDAADADTDADTDDDPDDDPDADAEEAEKIAGQARGAFVIGATTTDAQDLAYSIRQLAEIALRALSPSLNDPYTAMKCIDHLGDALATLASRRLLRQRVKDEDGAVRIIRATVQYEDLLSYAFDDIRRASERQVAVTIRLLDVLGRVRASSRLASRRDSIADLARCTAEVVIATELPERDGQMVRRAAASACGGPIAPVDEDDGVAERRVSSGRRHEDRT